jgi:hypothetical protein
MTSAEPNDIDETGAREQLVPSWLGAARRYAAAMHGPAPHRDGTCDAMYPGASLDRYGRCLLVRATPRRTSIVATGRRRSPCGPPTMAGSRTARSTTARRSRSTPVAPVRRDVESRRARDESNPDPRTTSAAVALNYRRSPRRRRRHTARLRGVDSGWPAPHAERMLRSGASGPALALRLPRPRDSSHAGIA